MGFGFGMVVPGTLPAATLDAVVCESTAVDV
jgi:hypothetical protein